ncbi:MAG: hypothetical protein IK002_03015 [Treponema sp.]|uniref:hypothetical protein n=1 Tax=Treponema sp. TaxID=166 RepID=UPI00298D6199|nr:hypothetical protein [Treponema sp.]MBR5932938.1 hypothetical protein [Treponema sp.]
MKEETKEKTKTFMNKVKKVFDRGIVASKKALGVAGDAVQDFSDKSVLRIEKMQLETKLKKQYEMLGEYAFSVLTKKSSVSITDTKVSSALKEIKRINSEIKIRENALSQEGPVNMEEVKAKSSKAPAKTSAKKAKTSTKTAAKKTPGKTAKSTAKKTSSKK